MSNQTALFYQVSERIGQKNLVTELSELLGIGKSGIYKRMNGTILLNFEEITKICLTYNISFDSIMNYQGKLVPFQFNSMFNPEFEILQYLTRMAGELKELSELEDASIIMTAMDLPFFRQFGFKALARFKLFFWQRSVLNLPEFRHKKFNWQETTVEYEEITDAIYESYNGISSTEIWAPETMESTIKQIEYYFESGLFEDIESANEVCNAMEDLLRQLEKEAEMGKKQIITSHGIISSKFQMYQSDIFLDNNCIQAKKYGKTYTYVSYNSFNALMSFSPQFSDECYKWIEQIRLKSVLLSKVSEKLRYQYFLKLQNRVDTLRQLIKAV